MSTLRRGCDRQRATARPVSRAPRAARRRRRSPRRGDGSARTARAPSAGRRRARRGRRARTRPGGDAPGRDSAGTARRSSVAIASVKRPRSASEPAQHDAALGDERAGRRRRGELFPQLLDPAVLAECAGAVHQHRMLLDRAGEVDERLELLGRGRVLAEPVLAEPEQLPHGARVGVGVAQRAQEPGRIAFVPGVERLGRAGELGWAWRAPGPRCGRARRRPRLSGAAPACRRGRSTLVAARRRFGLRRRLRRGRAPDLAQRRPPACSERGLGSSFLRAEFGARVVDPAAGRVALVAAARRPFAIADTASRLARAPRAVRFCGPSPAELRGPVAPPVRVGRFRRAPLPAVARRCPPSLRTVRFDPAPRTSRLRRPRPRGSRRLAPLAPRPAPRRSGGSGVSGVPGGVAVARARPRALGAVVRAARVAVVRPLDSLPWGRCSVREDARHDGRASSSKKPGGDLLSQGDYLQVPSARAVLTAVFGMGTGVSPPPWPPGSTVSLG